MKQYIGNHVVRWFTIIALSILAGATVYFCLYDHNPKNCNPYSDSEDREYLIVFEQVCKQMTEDQRLDRKHFAEEVLNKIESDLESDSLNPEERHHNLLSKRLIKQELEIINRYLKQ